MGECPASPLLTRSKAQGIKCLKPYNNISAELPEHLQRWKKYSHLKLEKSSNTTEQMQSDLHNAFQNNTHNIIGLSFLICVFSLYCCNFLWLCWAVCMIIPCINNKKDSRSVQVRWTDWGLLDMIMAITWRGHSVSLYVTAILFK